MIVIFRTKKQHVRFGMLFICEKQLYDRRISLREDVRTYNSGVFFCSCAMYQVRKVREILYNWLEAPMWPLFLNLSDMVWYFCCLFFLIYFDRTEFENKYMSNVHSRNLRKFGILFHNKFLIKIIFEN